MPPNFCEYSASADLSRAHAAGPADTNWHGPPDQIIVDDVLNILGGKIYEETFCGTHAGAIDVCNHIIDCSMRSLWRSVQNAVDVVLKRITLRDMLGNEKVVTELVTSLNKEITEYAAPPNESQAV